jgi:hypothetical protein
MRTLTVLGLMADGTGYVGTYFAHPGYLPFRRGDSMGAFDR